VQDGLLAGGSRGALRDPALGGGQGDQVHPVQFVPQVAAGVVGCGLGDPDEQRQPAQLDVGADPALTVVVDGPQPQRALHVLPAALDRDQLLEGGGQVIGGERLVVGAQQPLAVQARFPLDGTAVDAQQPALGAAQEPAQPRLILQRACELVALALGPGIRAADSCVRSGPLPCMPDN
jgi:hypothetical protein